MDPLDLLYDTLKQIQTGIFDNTLDAVCQKHYEACQASPEFKAAADKIRAIDWSEFNRETIKLLVDAFNEPDAQSELQNVKAIYYEYDMDNGWDGYFFLCTDYNGLDTADEDGYVNDDWACDYCASFEAPQLPVLPDSNLTYDDELDNPALRYAITELTRYFVKLNADLHEAAPHLPNIYLAFHDQDPITRLVKD
ncbi:MAG: hypothetical protein IJU03_00405 [Thermoguttaceae bacterium]|nr:hypothetical protein [Thermoguttaceae bacterium]